MKVKLLALCLFFSCGVFSQYRYIKEEDLKLINIVQTKIKNDTIAYKHFLFTKKCLCYDKVDNKKVISEEIIKWMGYLAYPLYIVVDKEQLKNNINKVLDDEITIEKKEFGLREEKFSSVSNKYIICESIAANTLTNRKQFLNFINNVNHFDRYKYKGELESYLKNNKILEENKNSDIIRYTNKFWGN